MGNCRTGYQSAAEWLRSPEPLRWRRTYPGRLDQVAVARRFAVSLFAGTGYEDEVGFIVTELASNAVRHSYSGHRGGWFGLEVVLDDVAYVGVTDQGGGGVPIVLPELPDQPMTEHGRGLRAVSKLAMALGIHGSGDGGHTVWADLDLCAETGTRPDLQAVLSS
ncbi:Histidine kinase-like ATPase domain-containing protein [Thermomonospora echinospora]|uniref:Histidine kinase-like ATPase domain-containing protein n=1 Tax=Thermomonospora echinospora TaxID=1992 RepID=A0A1H6D1R7_9ACTN|nr:ATP-binding protein [Thermomonospora echinospora]SEG79014.1 Histidine kinase-like ATPase domain-containing protein [Thermomonospora echinospora]